MVNMDAWGKSICFNQIVFSAKDQIGFDTNTARFYARTAREIMENVVSDLGYIIEQDYGAASRSSSLHDTLGITKVLGYKPQGSIEEDKIAARGIKTVLEDSVLGVTMMINNPSKFYEDLKGVNHLVETAKRIRSFYDGESGTSVERYTSVA